MEPVKPTSVLSDGTIRRLLDEGRLVIDPWEPEMIQPASVDLKLGTSFRVFHNHRIRHIDLADPPRDLTELVTVDAGEEFVIHPSEFVLGRTAEEVELADDLVARIEGKALALDTRIPTPEGWTTMGEIEVGDEVFDPFGFPIEVTAATEPRADRPCFRVAFSDGTEVTADAKHLWEVQTKYDRKTGRRRLLTTEEIRRNLKCSETEFTYHVPQAEPIQYPKQRLPIDPYVFGAWVGDGTSTKAEITCVDQPILDQIERAGYRVARASNSMAYRIGGTGQTRDAATGQYRRNGSLSSRLRDLGLLGNKHIPRKYMEADTGQRRALLEGLMDTDGYVDKWARCDLTTVEPGLAVQYRELIASLGYRPKTAKKRAVLNGRDCGPKYEVQFTPHNTVFRLPRKAARQKLFARSYPPRRSRGIVSVDPVASVPVRCIAVKSRRGSYLITDSCIVTHNSSLGRLGLIVHATAGFVDPGFQGSLTLEITNFNSVPIVLRPGLPIAQLSLMGLDAPAERPYGHEDLGSHYQSQSDATESRYEGGPARREGA